MNLIKLFLTILFLLEGTLSTNLKLKTTLSSSADAYLEAFNALNAKMENRNKNKFTDIDSERALVYKRAE